MNKRNFILAFVDELVYKWKRRKCRIHGHVMIKNPDKYYRLGGGAKEWCYLCDYTVWS